MIKSIAIALAALLVSGHAFAQNTTTAMPDGNGGWDTTTTAPNGHIVGNSSSAPNGIGGWNTTTTTAPNGHITGNSTTVPNGNGGWITTPSIHRFRQLLFLFSRETMEMTQELFQAACAALWAPQYRSEMARQLDVHLRTVMRWDSGETKISAAAWERLGKLLRERKQRIDQVLSKIEVA